MDLGKRANSLSAQRATQYSDKKPDFDSNQFPQFPPQAELQGVRDTEVIGIPPGVRSEALKCVQLAAAFLGRKLASASGALAILAKPLSRAGRP